MQEQAQAAEAKVAEAQVGDSSGIATPEEKVVGRVGFECALDIFNTNWRTAWTQEQIDAARFFYTRGLADTTIFVNTAISNLQAAYKWLDENAINTAPKPAPEPAAEVAVADEAVAEVAVAPTVVDTAVTMELASAEVAVQVEVQIEAEVAAPVQEVVEPAAEAEPEAAVAEEVNLFADKQ